MTPSQDESTYPEANHIFHKPIGWKVEDCGSLAVHLAEDAHGRVIISKWHLSFRERLAALFFGKVWLYIHSDGQPPVAMFAARTAFEKPHP